MTEKNTSTHVFPLHQKGLGTIYTYISIGACVCVCVICAFEFVIIPEDLEVVKRQHVPKPVRRKDICTTTVFSLRPLRMLACSAIDLKK